MQLGLPRLHLFEIDDQPWFPASLRTHVQSALTLFWTLHIPLIQPCAPATLVARKLRALLGDSLPEYTFVDFCSGAGGPTCEIERAVNEALRARGSEGEEKKWEGEGDTDAVDGVLRNGAETPARKRQNAGEWIADALPASDPIGVDFILTDLHPHLTAWRSAARQRPRLHYVPVPVDAAAAPTKLTALAEPRLPRPSAHTPRKQFHIFSLAFHHFDDPLARRILAHMLSTAHGFAVFELQARTLGALGTILMLGPLLWAVGWWQFWGRWELLFWIYVVPVVPFVLVFDGLVSCLRTRRGDEVRALMGAGRKGWTVVDGSEVHSWPGGEFGWVFGVREQRD